MVYLPSMKMKVSTYTWIIGAAFFVFLGSFGITGWTMPSNADGAMSGCPLSGSGAPALCHMSPLEHAFTLQTMLTAVPSFSLIALLTALLISLTLVLIAPFLWSILVVFFESTIGPPPATGRTIPRHALQEAYASGVLNSKAF